jgi:hypothetical protein
MGNIVSSRAEAATLAAKAAQPGQRRQGIRCQDAHEKLWREHDRMDSPLPAAPTPTRQRLTIVPARELVRDHLWPAGPLLTFR